MRNSWVNYRVLPPHALVKFHLGKMNLGGVSSKIDHFQRVPINVTD